MGESWDWMEGVKGLISKNAYCIHMVTLVWNKKCFVVVKKRKHSVV